MDLKSFYDHFLEENELVRANLMNDRDFETMESLASYKVDSLRNAENLAEVSEHISMSEAALIRSLADIQTGDNLHRLSYDVTKFGTLIDYQYILEEGDGYGVIHQDIVQAIDDALKEIGIIPSVDMYIHNDVDFGPQIIGRLEQIYTGPIYWLYNNLTWRELRALLKRLNSETEGNQKDDYLHHVTALLTAPQFLEEVLQYIDDEELEIIKDNVDRNYHIYEAKSRWEEAKNLGLIVKVHTDYYVMHEKVLEALKSVNFTTVPKRRRRPAGYVKAHRSDYNAYLIRLEVKDAHEPIFREVQVPAGINFFELHLIIREVMDWRSSSPSRFKSEEFEIYETMLQMNEEIDTDNGILHLLSSFTQVDALLDRVGEIDYHYESIDGYIVKITLEDSINIDRSVPGVTHHSGTIPIENVGGTEGLEKTMEVLNDRQHPDFARMFEKARTMNYRERYPVTAINNKLERLFRKAHPVTEFNVDE